MKSTWIRIVVVLTLAALWAHSLTAADDGSGVFFPEKETRLRQTYHGEPPGYPGVLDEKDEQGNPRYPKWGNPELEIYPGSVEHFRTEQAKYLPQWPMVDIKSLVRNFRATELPGIAPTAIEEFAEPVYYLPMYGPERPTGRRNPPVKVVRCRPHAPIFRLDFGTLSPSFYCIRLIGAAETHHVSGIRAPAYVEFKVNDGPAGEVSRYRLRVGYTDNFYSVAEFYFYAPERRAYHAEIYLGEGSQVDILAHNIDLHDMYTGLVRRPIKERCNTFDLAVRDELRAELKARLAAGDRDWLAEFRKKNYIERDLTKPYRPAPLSPQERARRDEEIWFALPPLNTQTGKGYGTAPTGPGSPEAQKLAAEAGTWKLAGPWDTRWELVNDKLKLRYTWEDLAAHKPLPEPWPFREDAGGLTFPPQPGEPYPSTLMTIANAVSQRIGDFQERLSGRAVHWAGLAAFYHYTGDREAARDAAMALVRWAYILPTLDVSRLSLNSAIVGRTRDLNWGGKDQWTSRRLTRSEAGLYAVGYLTAYDQLYDFIRDNEELAQAVNRYIPWIRTSQDLMTFLDMNLLQYTAKRQARWYMHNHDLFATVMAVGNTEFTRPWMEYLFRETWEYPQARAGMPDYAITSTQRDGTSYIGSWYYAMDGGAAMRYAEKTASYIARGGDRKYDLSDLRRFPKALTGCYFQIEGRVAGLHPLGIGDVNGPNLPYGHWFDLGAPEHQARLGWKWSRDPRFAYVLANYFGPKGETQAEWAEIQKAAQGVPNPWFSQRSRVLSNWAGILEAGTQHTDFRFRRAAMVRVGYGWGHQHDDTLDLVLWCHGVIHAAEGGERPEQRQLGDVHSPPDQKSYIHNVVEVDGDGSHRSGNWRGHSWVRTLKDTAGARYLMAESYPSINHPNVSLFQRQVALVDVDEGTPLEKQPSEPKEFHPSFRLPPVAKRPDAYVFDVFRVRGGKRHTYCFHGCEEDEFTTNAVNVRPVGFTYGDKADDSPEARYLNKFVVAASKTVGIAPEILQATWRLQRGGDAIELTLPEKDAAGKDQPVVKKRMNRHNTEARILGANYDANAPRKYTRLYLFEHPGIKVLTGKWVASSPNVTLQCLFAQKDGEEGMESVFPAIIEMYEGQPCIASVRSVAVADNKQDALRAVAVEVTLTDGRKDICFADGRPEQVRTLKVQDQECQVRGEFAFFLMDGAGLRQATLVGGNQLDVPGLHIFAEVTERRGRIVEVDYFARKATVEGLRIANPALLRGTSMEVGQPDHRTSYMIEDASVEGGRTILYFRKGMDFYSSRVVSVDEARREVRCGLGFPTDDGVVYPGMSRSLVASNEALTKFWRAEYLGGSREDGYVFRLSGAPVTAADFGEKGGLRIWEFGVGDEVRIPTHVSLRRNEDGTWTSEADVDCELTFRGREAEMSRDGKVWQPLRNWNALRDWVSVRISEAQLGAGTLLLRIR